MKKLAPAEILVTDQRVEISDVTLVPKVTKKPKRSKQSADVVGSLEIPLVFREGRYWVSSMTLAQHFEKQHKHVLDSIAEYATPQNRSADFSADLFLSKEGKRLKSTHVEEESLSDFFLENSRKGTYLDEYGRKQTHYMLTRDGSAYLGMSFTGKKAASFKIKLIRRFNFLESEYQKRQDPLWQLDRQDGKEQRGFATEAISELVGYAKGTEPGTKYATGFPYWRITNSTHFLLFQVQGIANLRDFLSRKHLKMLEMAELMVEKGIRAGIQTRLTCTEIYHAVMDEIERWVMYVGRADYRHLLPTKPQTALPAPKKPRKKKLTLIEELSL